MVRGCMGVRGRLGILIGFGEPARASWLAAETGSRNGDWSPEVRTDTRPFGGDCGGCTVTDGVCVCIDRPCGLAAGGRRVDACGSAGASLPSWPAGGLSIGERFGGLMGALAGLFGGTLPVSCNGLKLRSLSGFGAGEIGREGACCCCCCCCPPEGWFMVSNRARREDTGF